MNDARQPYSAAAADLLARHNKKKEKKIYKPEPDFNRIFLDEMDLALRLLTKASTQRLDAYGWLELEKVMNNIHGDKFRITDAPRACATCAT